MITIATDRRRGERKQEHADRLIGYAEPAMRAFREATGEVSNPDDLIRCLLLWSMSNGFGIDPDLIAPAAIEKARSTMPARRRKRVGEPTP